jgi:hypothetical protein
VNPSSRANSAGSGAIGGSTLTAIRGSRTIPSPRAILHAEATPDDQHYVAVATVRVGEVILDVKVDRDGRLMPPEGVHVGTALAQDIVRAITKMVVEASVAQRSSAHPRLTRARREALFTRGERGLAAAFRALEHAAPSESLLHLPRRTTAIETQ